MSDKTIDVSWTCKQRRLLGGYKYSYEVTYGDLNRRDSGITPSIEIFEAMLERVVAEFQAKIKAWKLDQ